MSKDPAFLFYPGDWLGGTLLMSRPHKGAYMDILMAQYNNGHMTLKEIKTVLGEKDELFWDEILKTKFIQDEEGKYFNKKLDDEIVKRKSYTDSRKRNLKKSTSHMETHMDTHMEDEDDNSIINYKGVLENFHLYCDKLPKIAKLSDQRKQHISARFKEFNYDTIIEVLKKAGNSEFLSGDNDRKWKADFDWIFKPTNFLKIMEGKYDSKKVNGGRNAGLSVKANNLITYETEIK